MTLLTLHAHGTAINFPTETQRNAHADVSSLIVESRLVGVRISGGAGKLLIQSLWNREFLGEYRRSTEGQARSTENFDGVWQRITRA